MSFFSFFRSSKRECRSRHAKRGRSAKLMLEALEGRSLPSSNVISGYAFLDANNNGIFDPGESPIANSTIQLRNAANVVIGTAITDNTGYYQFATDSTISTAPTTLTRTATIPTNSTDWTKSLSVAQFDPSLGTLLSVDIVNAGTFTSQIKVESLDSAPSTVTATDAGTLTLSGQGFAALVTSSSTGKTFDASAFDGIIDFGGTSGHDFGSQSANGSNSATVSASGDLAAYTGSGLASFSETAHANSSASGAGNLITQISTSATVQISIIYHYIPSNALKPGSYTIVQVSQPPNLLEGLESSSGVPIPGSVGSDTIPVTLGTSDSTHNDFADLQPSSLAGFVYYDQNDNGIKEAGEPGIASVTINLTGTNDLGPVTLTTFTATDGSYQFNNLRPGSYIISETQPANYLQGKNSVGSLGGTTSSDQFTAIVISQGSAGINYNFGELAGAGLSGFVYMDANNNGARDPGEPPIPNTTINLTGTDDLANAVNLSQQTGSDGSYAFGGLRPGTYTVTETQPTGYLQGKNTAGSLGGTLGNDQILGVHLVAGAAGTNYNFGELSGASISGFVYMDSNDNGARDSGEPPILGVAITLSGTNDLGNTVSLTQQTGSDGSYAFQGLRPGNYSVTETQPSGYLQGKNSVGSAGGTLGSDQILNIQIAAATAGLNYNFGELLPASISGFVYMDANDNGIKDNGEPAISNVAIILSGTNDLGNTVTLTQQTGSDGSYAFGGMRPGAYTVAETQPAGYLQGKNSVGSAGGTLGNDQIANIQLVAAATGINYNFAELLPASISGFVYMDSNDNGVKDNGEPPIPNTTISLSGVTDLGNAVNLTQQSGTNGSYAFGGLRPGTYSVAESQPAGYLQGKNSVGSAGGSLGNDQILNIHLAAAVVGANYNFGELQGASFSGFVYVDTNNDGVMEPGEPPIPNTTVTLTGTDDVGSSVNLTRRTGSDGSYAFQGLRPGTYTVAETQPAGYLQGKNSVGSAGGTLGNDRILNVHLAVAAAGTNYNFGELLGASISGFVYVDTNNDGIREPGEPPIPNTTLTVAGTNDLGSAVNLTQQTGADGSYHFQGLRQGVYAVTETQPAAYDEGKNSVGSAGGTLGNDQIFNIHLTAAVAATNYNFGELTPTSQILVSSFTCPNFSFGHPDLIILSKLQFLSTIPASTNNPVLIAQATYVDGLYRAILGRPADEPALISWVLQLHQGLSPMQLVQDLWNSAEHRGLEVDDFYQTILHRGADAMGRAIWVNVLQAGASEADVESMLYASAEYQSSHPDNNSFVTGLYADVLSRNASSAEIAGFVQALQNGASRQQVARIFLTSAEAYMQSLDCDYRSLLRRVPDNQGEQTWLAMLGSGQIMPATVTQIFLSSNEFIADAQQASMS